MELNSKRSRWTWPGDLWIDIRHALRGLAKSPGFTLAVLAALALGIGANTAIFTVVNGVLLRPLPYPDSGRLVNIGRAKVTVSVPMFTYWEQNNPGFADLAAYQGPEAISLEGRDRPELVTAVKTSAKYFALFGASPVIGRTFSAEEDRPRGTRALVLSFNSWQNRFSGDPAILGASVVLGGAPYSVVGVLSPAFQPHPAADVWLPLQADPESIDQAHILTVSGRLPTGVTLAQANAWMAVIGQQYVQSHPRQLGSDDKLRVTPVQQQITGDTRPALELLLGAVGLVLLIACANVANLLLARATGRQRELTVRAALGASRGRIVRQFLTESLMLAAGGGIFGLLLGSVGVRALLALIPGNLPRLQEMTSGGMLHPWVAGFTTLLAVLAALLFGLVPAAQASRVDLVTSLKGSGGRAGAGLKQTRTRDVLCAAEVGIAVVLCCGAGLLIRSFAAMHNVDLGVDPHNVLTMQVSLAGPGYSRSSDVDQIATEFVDRAERIPGVESASLASSMPLWGNQDMIFDIPGRAPLEGFKFTGDVQWRLVSPHYFEVLRIPLLSGRLLGEREPGGTVLINRTMARQFWPNRDPVGQTIVIGPGLGKEYDQGPVSIVGVVGDVREQLENEPPPAMYQAPSQIPDGAIVLVNLLNPDAIMVRTRPGVPPMSVSRQVEQALLDIHNLPVTRVRTLEQSIGASTARQDFNLLLLALFACTALLMAAFGIYGVMSYTVQQRTHEIGIRSALGATSRQTLRLVLLHALKTALAGIALGVVASLGLTRFLAAELFGVKPGDPITFVAVSTLLAAVAVAAAFIPATRATRVDPIEALRWD